MPYNLLKVNWCSGGTYRLHLQGRKISQATKCFMLLSHFDYSSAWKSRWLVPPKFWLSKNTLWYILQDRTLHNNRCENLKSCGDISVVNVTPCSAVEAHCLLGGAYSLQLQGQWLSQASEPIGSRAVLASILVDCFVVSFSETSINLLHGVSVDHSLSSDKLNPTLIRSCYKQRYKINAL
jgi:hypothetical protein